MNEGTKARVVIVGCPDYRPENVARAVAEGFGLLGPLERVLPAGRRILLKPNLLHGDKPERGSTTHPAVFSAVAGALKARGYDLVYGDSPAFQSTRGAVAASGYERAAAALGVGLVDFDAGEERAFPEGRQNKVFYVAKGVLDAGAVVNLPKLKTHALTQMTGAVKNMFGVIPGLKKSWFHARLSDEESFSRMLVDLNRLVTPALSVMDAVEGMEGNGPRNGTLVRTGLLLLATDPVALDAVACRVMGIAPEKVYFLSYAARIGFGVIGEDEIEIAGVPLERAKGRPYARQPADRKVFSKSPLLKYLKRFLIPRPVIDERRCTRCLQCVRICPVEPKALTRGASRKPPRFDYHRCIRCYCCQETCPEGAIKSRVPPLGVLFHGFGKRF